MVAFKRSPAVAVGDRVKLLEMVSDPNPIPSGTFGTVWQVDSLGTAHVRWDNGRELGLVPERDRYELVARPS